MSLTHHALVAEKGLHRFDSVTECKALRERDENEEGGGSGSVRLPTQPHRVRGPAARVCAGRPKAMEGPAPAVYARTSHFLAAAAYVLFMCGTPVSQAAVPVPGDAAIALTGESGKTSESHTLGFVLEAGERPPVLLAGDLVRTTPSPARIDRSQVQVKPAAESPAMLANYEISVTGLPERYGRYQGTIVVKNGARGTSASSIALTLLVRVPATQPLTALPPAVELPLVAGNASGRSPLSNWPSVGDVRVSVAGLPAGAEVAGVRMTPLVSARGYGELGGRKYRVEASLGGMRFYADAAQARPDKYTAIAEIELAGSDRRIAVPVEVTVRTAPVFVIALLILGILLGRAAKWMNEGGLKLLTAQGRLNSLALRAAALDDDYRRHLDVPMAALQRLVNEDRLGDFDVASGVLQTTVEMLEHAVSLRALARLQNDAGAQARLDAIAAQLRYLAKPESVKGQLDTIESGLTNPPPHGNANGNAAAMAPAPANAARGAGSARPSSKLRLAVGLHPVLELAGVVLLAFVGYEVLYLNGSPTFGANFSDYFGVLVWGLSADVAARTISGLGRMPAR